MLGKLNTVLVPRGDGVFQIGEEITPEVLRFEAVVAALAAMAGRLRPWISGPAVTHTQ